MAVAIDALVLGTVNAPYRTKLDAVALTRLIIAPPDLRGAAGPLSSFFYDVSKDLQIAFAKAHGISEAQLKDTARAFDAWTGQRSAILA